MKAPSAPKGEHVAIFPRKCTTAPSLAPTSVRLSVSGCCAAVCPIPPGLVYMMYVVCMSAERQLRSDVAALERSVYHLRSLYVCLSVSVCLQSVSYARTWPPWSGASTT